MGQRDESGAEDNEALAGEGDPVVLSAEAGGYQEARSWLERAAEKGDARSAALLGELAWASDWAESRRWYEKAASLGDSGSMVFLGHLARGRDKAGARQWYARAAALGDASGLYELGRVYVAWEPDEARRYFEQAAQRGHAEATAWLGILADRDGELAVGLEWYQKAAVLGHPRAPDMVRRRQYTLRPGPLPWLVRSGHKVGRTIFKRHVPRLLRGW